MPEQSGPPAAGQNAKTVIQMVCKFSDPEYADARCCQLKRQRYPIEPATDLQDCRHIEVSHHEPVDCRCGAFVEQLHGGVAQCLVRGHVRIDRKLQRCQAM